MDISEEVSDPLGIWPFPLINAAVKIVKIRNEDGEEETKDRTLQTLRDG